MAHRHNFQSRLASLDTTANNTFCWGKRDVVFREPYLAHLPKPLSTSPITVTRLRAKQSIVLFYTSPPTTVGLNLLRQDGAHVTIIRARYARAVGRLDGWANLPSVGGGALSCRRTPVHVGVACAVRYSVMWCLRHGVVVWWCMCVCWCVCCVLFIGGVLRGWVSCDTLAGLHVCRLNSRCGCKVVPSPPASEHQLVAAAVHREAAVHVIVRVIGSSVYNRCVASQAKTTSGERCERSGWRPNEPDAPGRD